MALLLITSQRIIFFPRQAIHASRAVDLTLRRVPLTVSAWVLTRINFNNCQCWTRTLSTLSIASSLSIFRHTYQIRPLTRTTLMATSILKSRSRAPLSLIWWHRQTTGLPYLSQILTLITLIMIIIACNSSLPSSILNYVPAKFRTNYWTFCFKHATQYFVLILYFHIYLVCVLSSFNYTSRSCWQFAIFLVLKEMIKIHFFLRPYLICSMFVPRRLIILTGPSSYSVPMLKVA